MVDLKIIGFENAIKRPYFDVHPLDSSELNNWRSYLDFIEQENDYIKVVKLYERCMIACANYPEFWIRLISCMEARGSTDLANNALARATEIFVKRRPEIHHFAAKFSERNGDTTNARAEYQFVLFMHSENSCVSLQAINDHANMEYRLGLKEEASFVYLRAIATEQEIEHSLILPMLYVQYSRFLYLVANEVDKSMALLVWPLDQIFLAKLVLEALILTEAIESDPKRIDYLESLVDKYVLPTPPPGGIHII